MAFEIQVKVDTSQAKGGLDELNKLAAQLEQSGVSAGAKLTSGLNESSVSAQKAKQGVSTLADELDRISNDPLGQFNGSMTRSMELLDQIRGPVRQYESDLKLLNDMLDHGTLSVNEYTDAVTKMNRELQRARPSEFTGTTGRDSFGPVFDPAKAGMGPNAGETFGPVFDAAQAGRGGFAGQLQGMLGSLGPAGGQLAQFASAEALAAGGAVALGVALVKIGDEYTELTNSVQRFATSTRSADDIVRDQLQIAGQLHASLSETSALSLRAAEVGQSANLTYAQQDALTKTLAESMQLSGRSAGEAAGVMDKLVFAMDQGSLSGRELRSIMRADPVLAESWEAYFHTTGAGLMEMAKNGKISAQDILRATLDSTSQMDAAHSKLTETTGQAWQHLKDQVVVAFGEMGQAAGGNIKSIISGLGGVVSVLGEVAKGASAAGSALGSMGGGKVGETWDFLQKFNPTNLLSTGANSVTSLIDQAGSHMDTSALQKAADETRQFSVIVNDLRDKFERLGDTVGNTDPWDEATKGARAWGDVVHQVLGIMGTDVRWVDVGIAKLHSTLSDATTDLGAIMSRLLSGDLVSTIMSGKSWTDANGNLTKDPWMTADTAMKKYHEHLSEEDKLLKQITEARTKYADGMNYVNDLFFSGKITAAEYYNELQKLKELAPKVENMHGGDAARGILPNLGGPLSLLKDSVAGGSEVGGSFKDMAEQTKLAVTPFEDAMKAAQKFDEQLKSLDTPSQKYADELHKIAEAQEAWTKAGDQNVAAKVNQSLTGLDLKTIGGGVGASLDALDKYKTQLAALADLNDRVHLSTAQLAQAQDELRLKFLEASGEARTFGGGLEVAFLKMKDEASNTGAQIGAIFKQVTSDISKSITDLVTGAKVDWKGMVDSLLADLTRLLINQAFTAIFGGGGGGGSGGGGGGGIGGIISAVASITGGGGDDTPGYATGGSFTVGGSGGTDSKLVAFRATPGEHIAIHTPEQRAQSGPMVVHATSPAPHVHIHMSPDELMSAVASHPQFETHVTNIAARVAGAQVGLRSRNR